MKTCFKCFQVLELSEFYKHPSMADSHLGKCKQCTKKDTKERQDLKMATDIQWVLSERGRQRLKMRAARACGRVKSGENKLRIKKYEAKHPHKRAAHNAVRRAIVSGRLTPQPCVKCGKKAQAHHNDYSKPLQVVWLCPRHHAEHHVHQNDVRVVSMFNSTGLKS